VRKVPRNMVTLLGPLAPRIAGSLAEINLSTHESWRYALKTLPRPAGRATRVVITEYDLPRKQIQPHDVVLDKGGTVWFSDFGENMLGEMDAKTGAVIEHHYDVRGPVIQRQSRPRDRCGQRTLARHDGSDRVRAIRHRDRQIRAASIAAADAQRLDPTGDGRSDPPQGRWQVWFNDTETIQIGRVDLNTVPTIRGGSRFARRARRPTPSMAYTRIRRTTCSSPILGEAIGCIDAKTARGSALLPTTTRSRPRPHGPQDRLWFAEFGAGKVAVFDTRTATFKEWDDCPPLIRRPTMPSSIGSAACGPPA
jgi:streptogramin lyase